MFIVQGCYGSLSVWFGEDIEPGLKELISRTVVPGMHAYRR